MPESNLVSILFRLYSTILEEEHFETLDAEIVNEEYGYFKIKTIPFYLPKLAAGDVVWAEFKEKEGMLTYRKTVKHSGNSTIHIVLTDEQYMITDICKEFEQLGCKPRILNHKYIGLNIQAEIDYFPIKQLLELLEKKKVIGYAESCLSEKHQYKNHLL